jgi:hypothetical protein
MPSKQSRESAEEQTLKRVKNSNVPESCLHFESEVEEINSVLKRDPQGFPDFDAADLSEGDSVDAADALTLIKEAIDRLNTNETKLAENIKDLAEADIEAANAGVKMAKKSGDDETGKKADAKAAPVADTPKP